MRDMAPRTDRSIRNIPVSGSHRKQAPRVEEEEYEDDAPQQPRPKRRRRRGSRLFLVAAIVVALICGTGGILLSTLFAGASVVVHPRTLVISQPATVSAQPSGGAGGLAYQTMTVTSTTSTSVPASGTQKVSRQASGQMVITNNYNSQTQRLIANTRFEAPDGKIYRIHDSVVVPGMVAGTPGTATVIVYADSPGVEYNKGPTHFTVPGFKKDPRYDKFYADAQAITGGFVGDEPAIAPEQLTATRAALKTHLEETVRTAIIPQVPPGFMLVENSFGFNYSDVSQQAEAGGKATLSQSVTAVAAIVKQGDLAAAVAAQAPQSSYGGEAVGFSDPASVHATITGDSKAPLSRIDITVLVPATIVWQYDPAALKTALLGKKKNEFESIITSFKPALTGAELTLRPFWEGSLPSNPDKITVKDGGAK